MGYQRNGGIFSPNDPATTFQNTQMPLNCSEFNFTPQELGTMCDLLRFGKNSDINLQKKTRAGM